MTEKLTFRTWEQQPKPPPDHIVSWDWFDSASDEAANASGGSRTSAISPSQRSHRHSLASHEKEPSSGSARVSTTEIARQPSEKADQTRLRFAAWHHDERRSSRLGWPPPISWALPRRCRDRVSSPPALSVCRESWLGTTP